MKILKSYEFYDAVFREVYKKNVSEKVNVLDKKSTLVLRV